MTSADALAERTAHTKSGIWFGGMVGTLVGVAVQLHQAQLNSRSTYAACGCISLGLMGVFAFVGWHQRQRPTQHGLKQDLGALARASPRATPQPSSAHTVQVAPGQRVPWWWRLAWACGSMILVGTLNWSVTGWRAGLRMQDRLQPRLADHAVVIEGVVEDLPQNTGAGVSFWLHPQAAWWEGEPVHLPERISLYWPSARASTPLIPALDRPVLTGQVWRLTARLKPPQAELNPGGIDLALWYLEQGIGATGLVQARASAPARLVREPTTGYALWHIDGWRQRLRERILVQVSDARTAGVIAALAMGDQAAIDRQDWDIFRRTGVAHLMSISGLHITMFAWLGSAFCSRLWRCSARLMRWWPAGQVGQILGVCWAALYALFAGWGVPAQRTVLMLAIVVFMSASARRWPSSWILGLAAAVVLWVDPWAWQQAGFWLSFVAVGVLMMSASGQTTMARSLRRTSPVDSNPLPASCATALQGPYAPPIASYPLGSWLQRIAILIGQHGLEMGRTQAIATLSLAPLCVAFFQQISLVSWLANLLAIPWVSFVITPLALLGSLFAPLWQLAAWAVQLCVSGLKLLAALPYAAWSLPLVEPWVVILATLGAIMLLLPLPWRWRVMGVGGVLLLLIPSEAPVRDGHLQVCLLDTSPTHWRWVRTATRTMLVASQSGPQGSKRVASTRESSARLTPQQGARLLAFTHALGAVPPDMIVSLGGTPAWAWAALLGLPQVTTRDCAQPQHWVQDGVRFDLGANTHNTCSLSIQGDVAQVLLTPEQQHLNTPSKHIAYQFSAQRSGEQPAQLAEGLGQRDTDVLMLQQHSCGALLWRDDSPADQVTAHELCLRLRDARYWR